jgi:hypothetical protein
MPWLFALFLIFFLSPPSQAFDLVSLFSRSNDQLYPTHEEFDFPSCAPYVTESNLNLNIACDYQHLSSMLNIPAIQDHQDVSRRVVEQALTEDFRQFMLEKIESRIQEQERLRNCFSSLIQPTPLASSWCQNRAEVIREDTREQLPLMRRHLSLMTPIDLAERVPSFRQAVFQFQPRLIHSRSSSPITPITPSEIPGLEAQFHEETQSYRQDWLSSIYPNVCVQRDNEGLFDFSNSFCEDSLKLSLNDSITIRREHNTYQHGQIYQQIISTSPHLPFISGYPLPVEDQELNHILSQSFDDLLAQSQEQLLRLQNRRADQFHFLYRYPQLIEAFLQDKGQSQLLCDAFQHLHDYHGSGGWFDLAADIGLAAGAIIGGGACILSSGLACAAVVAVGTEVLFIRRDQGHLNDGLTLFRAGMIDSDQMSELERNRNFSLALAPLSFIGLESGRGIARGFARRHLQRNSLRETQNWLHYNATTPAQNRLWIRAARQRTAQIYLDVENAALKRLNDSLGDKNLVTALTNLHKDILFREVERLREMYPHLSFERYSDFKSSRFAFSFEGGVVPEDFQTQLNRLLSDVGTQFDERVQNMRSLDLGEEVPSGWFASGLGESADQAGLAARQARMLDRSQISVRSFEDITPLLTQRRSSIETTRSLLEESFEQAPLDQLLTLAPSGHRVPTVDVFEVLRKGSNKSLEELQQVFRARFNIELPLEQTQLLRQYAQEVDQFSPGLWIEERVLANLDEAEFGGFSADFKGMGARNLYQVAVDLSYSGDTLAQNVERLRLGEELVTESFDTAKSGYDELIRRELTSMGVGVTNRCSGDDCVSLPASVLTREQEQQIVEAIASSGQADAYRLSFIPPGIRAQDRTLLGVHGELIEKQVRSVISGHLPGQISPDVMAQVTFAVRMPTRAGSGTIEVITATDPSLQLTDELRSQIHHAIASATDSVNADLGTQYGY